MISDFKKIDLDNSDLIMEFRDLINRLMSNKVGELKLIHSAKLNCYTIDVKSIDCTSINMKIYVSDINSKLPNYIQTFAVIDNIEVDVLNSYDYGTPDLNDVKYSLLYLKKLLFSEIKVYGYFDKNDILLFKSLEFKIDSIPREIVIGQKKISWLIKKKNKSLIETFKPWLNVE